MRLNLKYLVPLIVAVAVVLAWLLWDSPQRAIRGVLDDGEAAVEAKDLVGAMSHVSRQYLDEYGLNYLGTRRVLGWSFNRFQALDVLLHDVSVDVRGDRATARGKLQVLVRQGDESVSLIGAAGDPDLVTITLIRERLAWKVTSVNGIDVSRVGL
ncbi:MAG: hypothetical protein ACE5LB_18430 [Acidiferrobacterales bacterium]